MKYAPALLSALLAGSFSSALAGPLTEAQVHQIVNDVKIVDPQKGARPAAVRDTVRDQIAVRTGIQSRAELLFQDATLTRLGAETLFSFRAGTRDLSLERGTMLLQVPKGRGGARIRTASVTASITGTTIMIESLPGSSVKVLVLEGSLRLSANNRFGESVTLKPGKMVIMKPNATRIPDPVDVDIRKVMKTSALVDPVLFSGKSGAKVAALPSIPLIEKEIAVQDRQLQRQNLVATNLVIPGSGTKVVLASDQTLGQLERTVANVKESEERSRLARTVADRIAGTSDPTGGASGLPGSTSGDDGSFSTLLVGGGAAGTTGGLVGGGTGGAPAGAGGAPAGTGGTGGTGGAGGAGGTGGFLALVPAPLTDLVFTTDVDQDTFSATGRLVASGHVASRSISMGSSVEVDGALKARGGFALDASTFSIEGTAIRAGGGLQFDGGSRGQTVLGAMLLGPQSGGDVSLFANRIEFSATGINGANLRGGNGLVMPGGDGGALRIGTNSRPIPGEVVINAPINASTGINSLTHANGGVGGTVAVVAEGQIRVNSSIKVSDSAVVGTSNAGGRIGLVSALSGDDAIRIDSSAQLLSLLDGVASGPGGTIKLKATNGGVQVNGGTIHADRGDVEISGSGAGSRVTVNNANIRGDTVKVGALGANGELRVGGGTIHADTTLKLYGGSGSGAVRFTDNVTLSGNSTKIIAGNTVQIDNGRTVTVGGSAPARVHTNNPNYTGSGGNGSSTGQFGGAGATTQSYGSRPGF